MCEFPIKICNRLRPSLYDDDIAHAFPFCYNSTSNTLRLLHTFPFNPVNPNKINYFCKGALIEGDIVDDNGNISSRPLTPLDTPIIRDRIGGKTSQGKLFTAVVRLDKESNNVPKRSTKEESKPVKIKTVVKVDKLDKKSNEWWLQKDNKSLIKKRNGTFQCISASYMDALCSVVLSHLVETRSSPHFPVCYATQVAKAVYKRKGSQNVDLTTMLPKDQSKQSGTPSQIIWMEYLPYSMSRVLREEKEAPYWWSALIQIWAAMCYARRKYHVVHNDLHCNNVRVREVASDTFLYYKTSDGTFLKVPTYGYLYVIIDFGRSIVSPWSTEESILISSGS